MATIWGQEMGHCGAGTLVSRIPPTIYKVIERARKQEFTPRKSTNKRFLQAEYGMKRLAKVEVSLESQKKLAARRYNKSYPG